MAAINTSSTNISSVAKKAKLVVNKIKRLKNCRNENILNTYLNTEFKFPINLLKARESCSQKEKALMPLVLHLKYQNNQLKKKLHN